MGEPGKVAVVTGAARGVGRGVALALAETGATVHVTDRESRAQVQHGRPGGAQPPGDRPARGAAAGRAWGLLVFTGYTQPDADVIGDHLVYDLAMTAVCRLTHTAARDLRPHGVTAVAVSPGFTRTEAVLDALGDQLPPGTDSVEFPGRAVRALLGDPQVDRWAGRAVPVAELAAAYGFTDVE